MKDLGHGLETALRERHLRLGFLAEIEHEGGVGRYWSGVGTLTHDGHDWTSVGRMGRVTGMGETTEVRTTETRYELVGVTVDPALEDFISSPVRNKVARCWLAFFSEGWRDVIGTLLVDETTLDHAMTSIDEGLNQTLALIGNSAIFDFRKPLGIAITNEQQQQDFAGDTGFDRIPTDVADKQVVWTRT